ncbi:hypothetical protein ACJX0J_014674, partial [Zea mays]
INHLTSYNILDVISMLAVHFQSLNMIFGESIDKPKYDPNNIQYKANRNTSVHPLMLLFALHMANAFQRRDSCYIHHPSEYFFQAVVLYPLLVATIVSAAVFHKGFAMGVLFLGSFVPRLLGAMYSLAHKIVTKALEESGDAERSIILS